jgi:hypothetical protein
MLACRAHNHLINDSFAKAIERGLAFASCIVSRIGPTLTFVSNAAFPRDPCSR